MTSINILESNFWSWCRGSHPFHTSPDNFEKKEIFLSFFTFRVHCVFGHQKTQVFENGPHSGEFRKRRLFVWTDRNGSFGIRWCHTLYTTKITHPLQGTLSYFHTIQDAYFFWKRRKKIFGYLLDKALVSNES